MSETFPFGNIYTGIIGKENVGFVTPRSESASSMSGTEPFLTQPCTETEPFHCLNLGSSPISVAALFRSDPNPSKKISS